MKKEYIIEMKDLPYGDYKTWGDYVDVNAFSVRYRVDDESDLSDYGKWYVMGVDVVQEPESVKRQRERDKKIDSILK